MAPAPESGKSETNTAMADDGIELVTIARDAWVKVVHQTWDGWLAVGRAYQHGSRLAMHVAGSNRPFGRGYQRAFSAWATRTGFDVIALDAPTRSALAAILDHLEDVETWRATIPQNKRLRLNHPTTVLKAWRAATRPRDANATPPAQPMKAELQRLITENDTLKARLDERHDTALLVDLAADREADIVAALTGNATVLANPRRAVRIFRAVARELERRLKLDGQSQRRTNAMLTGGAP